MSEIIDGLKLISHNASGVNTPDDPSFPFKMEANFSPPEFMNMAFVMMYGGSEEIVVRSMTKEAMDQFVEMNNFRNHPRLRRLTITGPGPDGSDGVLEQINRQQLNKKGNTE